LMENGTVLDPIPGPVSSNEWMKFT
jgi:hypothetical protein